MYLSTLDFSEPKADLRTSYWDVKYIDVYEANEVNETGSGNDTSSTSTSASSTGIPQGGTGNTTTMSSTEPTTITTMTSLSTTTITVPSASGASSTETPLNPSRVGDYSYLGCFGSKTGFRTFNKSDESDEMTIEFCVKSCDGLTYAGVFEGYVGPDASIFDYY